MSDLDGLKCVHIEGVKKPFLLIIGSKGFLSCGYVNPEACSVTGDAVGIFKGVSTHDDILNSECKAVSDPGAALGMKVGDRANWVTMDGQVMHRVQEAYQIEPSTRTDDYILTKKSK
ncbi:hypothetical protein SARC_09613 [Sphaeroforma arctica JP610]|uniref:DUF1805 domain-containing protein n=1 Tax=Sphaeroforma arctica JP610 TaxID=667725 RepID=A0A0L0FMD9_9EUKA|nr:hypothetical protein SARC_09613 [Sphaeroforma arctica JP610]KNC77939.1 hypothetical protein SARC_09613 [Sphaeroforma arctica JP610]|eukprot:XP_014151841.1 hypothetical protein SARC_09613 [Sphaeroforma arctica JP610]